MAHKEQIQFCKWVRSKHPDLFVRTNIIDVGSHDINGNNRQFFSKPCSYVGVDIYPGKNVTIVGKAHEVLPIPALTPDVIISTEMLEHDKYWDSSLQAMYDALRPGGILVITCAGIGRPEHGTHDSNGWCSPGTLDYYQNLSNEMFGRILKPDMFTEYYLSQTPVFDLNFYGIKITA
jgi:SAM-dependent methyltransferase